MDYSREKLEVRPEKPVQELQRLLKQLAGEADWNTNISIKNRERQKKAFKNARKKGEAWEPDFRFKDPGKDLSTLKYNIEKCIEASKKIGVEDVRDAGFKVLEPEDLQEFFRESFKELKLYVELADRVEKRKAWKSISKEIWPMVPKKEFRKSVKKVEGLQPGEPEKVLDAEDLKKMFEDEISRLGFDYGVEIRDVSGCFNRPSEEKLVVANGEKGERRFSREEAEMLTKHEIFHVVRGVNGRGLSEKFDVLGVHSPLYDKTEEGGAVYRERKTGANYESKDFDYHLRLIAAYKMSRGEAFHNVVEELMELGGSLDRSFYLVARNREALRHHIYFSGIKAWEENSTEKLLMGKVSPEWAEKFWKEVEDGGFKRPEISGEAVFK
ncbi:MAG: tyrosine/phenylalanine carboxypeptidase domain-containing protein [Candidatus Nanohaloarchaea archaeon]